MYKGSPTFTPGVQKCESSIILIQLQFVVLGQSSILDQLCMDPFFEITLSVFQHTTYGSMKPYRVMHRTLPVAS